MDDPYTIGDKPRYAVGQRVLIDDGLTGEIRVITCHDYFDHDMWMYYIRCDTGERRRVDEPLITLLPSSS